MLFYTVNILIHHNDIAAARCQLVRNHRGEDLADAIINRIVHAAHRIAIEGESMRKKRLRNNDVDMEERNN